MQNESFSVEKLLYFPLEFYCFDASACLVDILSILHINLFQNFVCGTGIECVHDLGFSCQLVNFFRNSKAFPVNKGYTLFSKV